MANSNIGGSNEVLDVPDFARIQRTMVRANRRHVMDGLPCLRPSCSGTLGYRDSAVTCSDCDYAVSIGGGDTVTESG